MPIPDFQSLMLPVLRAVECTPTPVKFIRDTIAESLNIDPEEQRKLLPSGKQTVFVNRVAWALSYLQGAGLLERTGRGFYRITDHGQKIRESGRQSIDLAFLRTLPAFQEWRSNDASDTATAQRTQLDRPSSENGRDVLDPDERLQHAVAVIDESIRREINSRLHAETPAFFEQAVLDLLVAMGYGGGRIDRAAVLGQSGDGGIDGVINEDTLGLDQLYVQAKRYATGNSVGEPQLRDFAGSLDRHRATKGVFVTLSSFTAQARDYVKHSPKRIILIDGSELASLMLHHQVAVRTKDVYRIMEIDENYFSPE